MATSGSPEPEPAGPHTLPHGQRVRCSIEAKRLSGEPCTVVLIWDQERHSWVLYPHGIARMGVRIPDQDARQMAQAILDRGAVS